MFRKAFLALLCVTSLMAPAPLLAGQQQMSVSAFDFSFPSIEGTNLNLSDYQAVSYTHLTLPTTPYV